MTFIIDYLESNIFEVIGAILAISGAAIALVQWRLSIKTSRAKYVNDLLFRVLDDEKIQKFQHIADYSDEWYNEDFHRNEKSEIPGICDRTLFTYNYICYLYDNKEINESELEIFKYYFLAIAYEICLKYYFLDLYQYSVYSGKKFPFTHYLKFCKDNNCISEDICDENFYYYLLSMESRENGFDNAVAVPDNMKALIEETKGHLFIENVSRCRNCKHFTNNECTKGLLKGPDKKENHAGSNDSCSQFNFNIDKWQENNHI